MKPNTGFRLVSKSVTLNDFERRHINDHWRALSLRKLSLLFILNHLTPHPLYDEPLKLHHGVYCEQTIITGLLRGEQSLVR